MVRPKSLRRKGMSKRLANKIGRRKRKRRGRK